MFIHNHTEIAQSSKRQRGQIPRYTIERSYKGSMQRWNILGDSNSGTTNFFYVLVKQMQVQSIFKRRKKPWEGLSFRNEKSEDVIKRRTTAIITVIN